MWIEVNNLSSGQYYVNKNLRFKTLLLRSELRNYIDEYIVVKATIIVEADDHDEEIDKKRFINAPCRSCISKN